MARVLIVDPIAPAGEERLLRSVEIVRATASDKVADGSCSVL